MTKSFTASNFWDDRYQSKDYIYGRKPNEFLSDQAHLIQSDDLVLSLAEGEGRNAVFLAQKGCVVHSVDFSAKARAKALKLAEETGVKIHYEREDLSRYSLGSDKWNAVISIFCHLPQSDRAEFYRSIKQSLKPGGLFLLEGYNRRQLKYDTGGPKDSAYLTSIEELKTIFADWEIMIARDIERDVREGSGHTGIAAVTQFITRRPLP